MASGGSKQNMKLMIALGLLLVAGVVIFFQLRSGGGADTTPRGPKLSEAERQAQEKEHERQVKAAEAAMRANQSVPTAPHATTGGSN